tara:strand:- start:254 stop:670 length:417 start_codon:yes stop_codon:yes gene_type:complete
MSDEALRNDPGWLCWLLLCVLLCSYPVLWILLYGFVIFPNHPTHQMRCSGMESVGCSCHPERHYNVQTETHENIEVCDELDNSQIWTWACFAGVASAIFSPLVLGALCGFLEIVKDWIIGFQRIDRPAARGDEAEHDV